MHVAAEIAQLFNFFFLPKGFRKSLWEIKLSCIRVLKTWWS